MMVLYLTGSREASGLERCGSNHVNAGLRKNGAVKHKDGAVAG